MTRRRDKRPLAQIIAEDYGGSVRRAADENELDYFTLWRLATGRNTPRARTLREIARALDTTVEHLLNGDEHGKERT